MTEGDTVNFILAEAIRRIEKLEGNELYRRAWGKAARLLKDMMVEFNTSIIVKPEQISSSSALAGNTLHPPGGLCPLKGQS